MTGWQQVEMLSRGEWDEPTQGFRPQRVERAVWAVIRDGAITEWLDEHGQPWTPPEPHECRAVGPLVSSSPFAS